MNWQPIKTAPKNSNIIDIWSQEHGRLTNYQRIKSGSKNVFYEPVYCGVCCVRDATHWMPLPKPPTKKDDAQ